MNCYSRKIIRNATIEEYQKQYATQAKDMSVQIIATVLYCFHLKGWRKKRLYRLFKEINSTYSLMDGAVMGKKFNPDDCKNFIKDKYGIDLDKEVTVEVKTERG